MFSPICRVAPPQRPVSICAAPEAGEYERQPLVRRSVSRRIGLGKCSRTSEIWTGTRSHWSGSMVPVKLKYGVARWQEARSGTPALRKTPSPNGSGQTFPSDPAANYNVRIRGYVHPGPPGWRGLFRFPGPWPGPFRSGNGRRGRQGNGRGSTDGESQANLQIQCEMPLDHQELLRSVNQVFHKNTIEAPTQPVLCRIR
jgi:hypothetical protein